jgi:hypothetical protein
MAGTSWHKSDVRTGDNMYIGWMNNNDNTGNITGLHIDCITNRIVSTNLGATGLKIDTLSPNGAGKSYDIDVTANDSITAFVKFNQLGDAISNPGTLSVQVPVEWNGTVYYMYLYTTGS